MKLKELLITYLNNLSTARAKEGINKNDSKKMNLFNVFCLVWYLFIVLVITESLIENSFNGISKEAAISAILMAVSISVCRYFFYKKKYTIAYSYYIFQIIGLTFYFSNFLNKGELLEYYYIFAPAICLIFIDDKRIIYTSLFVSYLCLILPSLYFKQYPVGTLTDLSVSFLYFGIFIMVNYFKTLNRRNEKSLELKTQELEELNNFKSQFFTNVSHEIRTPITLIKGYNDELPEALHTPPKITYIQQNINQQIDKITEIINSVLDLAKMEKTEPVFHLAPVNIVEILHKIHISFEPLFRQKNISLLLEIKNKKCITYIDPLFIERALNNVVSNALKYTEKGSVTISLYCTKNKSILKIKDTGVGIPQKDVNKVFDRFYQVNNHINKSGGSGIGLSFTKEMLKLHNGKITVKSSLGAGSEFTIELPIYKKKENKKEHTISKDTKIVKNNTTNGTINLPNITFLIVDDTLEMRKYLKTILQKYKCLEAENGSDALEVMKQNTINFIITDYMMPTMNGYDFIKQLKNDGCNIPIIMLTAKKEVHLKLEILQLGVDDYMTKPFEKKELLIRIKNLLNNYKERENYIKTLPNTSIVVSDDFSKQLENFILLNLDKKELSQDDIADYFNISKSSLYRKLKSKTGLSPNEFVTEVKLQKAKTILENNPTILLKQLAYDVGFTNVYYFSTLYEKRFGCKPSNTGSA